MPNDFDRVKGAMPIDRYCREVGADLKRSGATTFANPAPCCAHKECCSLEVDKGVFHCHSCDAKGSVIDLHMVRSGLDKIEAMKELAGMAGIDLTPPSSKTEKLPTGKEGVWQAAVEVFHANLLANEGMLAYQLGQPPFEGVGRHHAIETIKRFRIGWADGNLITALQGRKFGQKTLIDSGLFKDRDGTPVDYFRDCFVYPHFDAAGRPLHFTNRFPKIEGNRQEDGRWRPGYQLKKDHRHKEWVCYNQASLGKSESIIVCEGMDDLLTWVDAGQPNVVATCGGPSQEQLDFFVRHHGGKTFLMAYDQDEAGAGFVDRFVRRGLRVKVIPMIEEVPA
jgi:DNA primase